MADGGQMAGRRRTGVQMAGRQTSAGNLVSRAADPSCFPITNRQGRFPNTYGGREDSRSAQEIYRADDIAERIGTAVES